MWATAWTAWCRPLPRWRQSRRRCFMRAEACSTRARTVITASELSWIAPFTGLSPRRFGKPVTLLRRQGADAVRKGRPWSRPLEDRALLVAAYWRTNLTMRQLAGSRSPQRTGSSTTWGRCSLSSPASGSPRTPCSSWTAPWSPPATTPSPSGRRTTGTPPTMRSSSTPTPDWSSWLASSSPGTALCCRESRCS